MLPVVLEVGQPGGDGRGDAGAGQAGQGEVVVQGDDLQQFVVHI